MISNQELCSSPSSHSSESAAQPMTRFETNSNRFDPILRTQMPSKPDNRIGTLLPPIYPPNYVSRAHIEEIVQTQVKVLDNRNNQTLH